MDLIYTLKSCAKEVGAENEIWETAFVHFSFPSVIDFCLTKVVSRDIVTNYTSLKLAWTSKASCKQRAGRSGRVSSGRVYRLIPQIFFEVGKYLSGIPLQLLYMTYEVLRHIPRWTADHYKWRVVNCLPAWDLTYQ